MKILDNLTDTVVRRVPIQPPLMAFNEALEETPRLSLDRHVRLRMEIALRTEMTGPTDSIMEMRRRAARMFMHELYGEVADELMQVMRLLYDENHYRAPNDPVLSRLNALASKLRGGGV